MWTINEAHFRRVDLNTLIVFMAVMRERSVTRAAERLLLGQPAVSHALNRLRDLFGDPLFVRSRDGMVPTPRAIAAFERLSGALTDVHDTVFDPPPFNPATVDATVRLGLPDDLDAVLLPRLMGRLARAAPGVRLVVRPADFRSIPDQLDREDIDLAVSAKPLDQRGWHRCTVLRREGFKCLFDPARFAASGRISMKAYLTAPHIIVSQSGDLHGAIDAQLAQLGHNRRVVMAAARFSVLPQLLKQGAFIANMPATCAAVFARDFGLCVSTLPFPTPRFDLALVTHRRLDADPLHVWVQGLLAALVAETHGPADSAS